MKEILPDWLDVANDPGRVNIATIITTDGTVFYVVTRKDYRWRCGYRRRLLRALERERSIRGVEALERERSIRGVEALDATTSTTSSLKKFRLYIRTLSSILDDVQRVRMSRVAANDDFRVHTMRQRFYTTLERKMKDKADGKEIRVAYGAATFPSSGRGEVPTPVKTFYRWMARTFPTVLTDEYNSSRVCAVCDAALWKVMKEKNGKRVEHRDQRWCPDCVRLVDRDANAAHNISRCRQAEVNGWERPWRLTPPTRLGPYQEITLEEALRGGGDIWCVSTAECSEGESEMEDMDTSDPPSLSLSFTQ